MYTIISDGSDAENIDLTDKPTGVHLTLTLRGEHAALALIGKAEKADIAKYGF